MVYYGAVSKGCERCRRRKIKCDQRKPACLKCERAKTECPGFRDLADIIFRDESQRITRRARTVNGNIQAEQAKSAPLTQRLVPARSAFLLPTTIPIALSQPMTELGANFFFANYGYDGPPLSGSCHAEWLTQVYCENARNHALRVAIEAAGMAGISNISNAPQLASKSKEHYGRALAAMKQALSDPIESVSDTTLMAVLLLGLFEFITFEKWDSWASHVEGATTLLRIRGQEQFTYELGGRLFMQVRAQIIYICVQRNIPVPRAMIEMSHLFESSPMGERRKQIRPGPMSNLCFRLLSLQAAIESGEVDDPQTIRNAASEMDHDLEAWRETLPHSWNYEIVPANDASSGQHFDGKRHVYSDLWTAQSLNNWRTFRIQVNGIILRHEIDSGSLNSVDDPAALVLIHQLSTEICISAASFMGTPRTVSLIWPLSVVSRERLNPQKMRSWAIEQLRRINASMGFRQAGLLADTISQDLLGEDGKEKKGPEIA